MTEPTKPVTGIASGLQAGAAADVAEVKAEAKSLMARVMPALVKYGIPAAALALGFFAGKHF